MDFFLVDVKSITASVSSEQIDKAKVEELADSILECNGLLKPLVLKPTGPESYVVIQGNKEYYAALKAREKNPRKGEMVNAFVISPKAEEAISKQLEALGNQDKSSSPVREKPKTMPIQTSLSFQKEIDNMMGSMSSQLTLMIQKMEKNLETIVNERLTQLENIMGSLSSQLTLMEKMEKNLEIVVNERLTKLENKTSEITKYDKMTVPKLKSLAKERKIKRYSTMKKAELINALEKSDMALK